MSIQDYTALSELVGVFVACVILLEVLVFFLIAGFRFVKTRRLAWFLTFGIMAVPVGAVTFSILVGVGWVDLSQQPPLEDADLRPVSFQKSCVEGKHVAYRVGENRLHGWAAQRDTQGMDFCLKRGSVHFGVLSEKLQFNGLDHMRAYFLDSLQGLGSCVETQRDERLEISGREWVHVEALVYIDGFVPQHYDLYGYTGSEGSVQLVGWMGKNEYEEGSTHIRDLASSFTFMTATQHSS